LAGGGNYNSDKWKIVNNMSSTDMLSIARAPENESGDLFKQITESGGLWDLSNAVSIEDGQIKGYTSMNMLGTKFVYIDGSVYEVIEKDGNGKWGVRNVDPEVDGTIYRPSDYKGR
jgi:hypothetical protein